MKAGRGPLFLGLDLGTSAVKVGLFDVQGNLLGRARRAYPLYTPRPGWAEQEPEDWWVAVCDALREVLAGVAARDVAAVGLSGQAPSQVLVAADGRPLGRAIVWSDRRAAAEAAWLAKHVSPEEAETWTGSSFVGGATQPPARLLWLKTHRPEDWAPCAAVVQPKDWLALRLTGRVATDTNSAGGLLDSRMSAYATELLARIDVDVEKMPPLLEPTAVLGPVTREAAAATGLLAGTPVVVGTVDAWCDIIGCGGTAPGCAVDVAGTSEVVALITAEHVDGEGVFGVPLAEGRHWVGGPMQVGGAALAWLAQGLYGHEAADFGLLEAEASAVEPGAEDLLFLPYLQGERSPVWDPAARAAFVGLTDRHTRRHCARAVYEGVAFAVRDLLERCQAAAGLAAEELRVTGGASVSGFWNQVKADVTGLPVQRLAVQDAACVGAALLAATGVGTYAGLDEAGEAMVRIGERFDPVSGRRPLYDELFAVWRQLYPALRAVFPRLGRSTG
jgi:xylulokinase